MGWPRQSLSMRRLKSGVSACKRCNPQSPGNPLLVDKSQAQFECNRLFRDRQKGDYVAFAEFDQAYIENQLQGCEAFLQNVRSLLNSCHRMRRTTSNRRRSRGTMHCSNCGAENPEGLKFCNEGESPLDGKWNIETNWVPVPEVMPPASHLTAR